MNNIYNKLAELQRQIQHCDPHMNSGDTIQIEAPEFDPDMDDISPTPIDQESNNRLTQGTTSPTPKSTEPEIECITPAPSNQHTAPQETVWSDAILVEIPSQIPRSFCSQLGGVCFVFRLFLISFAVVPEVSITLVM